MFKRNTAIIFGMGLAVSVGAAQADEIDAIGEVTIDVISYEQDAMDVDIPTYSLETEPESEPLADATQQRNEEQERTIDESANLEVGLAEMSEVRNENREERCNDLREDTKLEHERRERK